MELQMELGKRMELHVMELFYMELQNRLCILNFSVLDVSMI